MLALAWTAGAGLEAGAIRAEQAMEVHGCVSATACPLARGGGASRGAPVASLDGAAVWQRSLEAERVPDARLEGTLLTTTASGAAAVLRIHLIGRLDHDGMNRMLLLRVAAAGRLGGSAFLTVERRKAPPDIWVWVYLPSVGSPRRLSAGNLGESFLRSEFRLGDLLQPDPDEYVVTVRGAEEVGGQRVWVLDAVPRTWTVENRSGLGRQILWIGQDDALPRRVEQYDRRGTLLKVAEVLEWTPMLGARRWLARVRRIRNIQTGVVTSAIFDRVEIDVGIPATDFAPQHLVDASW